ncbi:MAG TPA: hypothetical protein VGL40_13425 [Bacillota bacterium]|jgi:hypothetical protein
MAHAYTPGLKVTEQTVVQKVRRLPLLGEVLVKVGDLVEPEDVVAKTDLPGNPVSVNVAHDLAIEPEDVPARMLKKVGDKLQRGEVIAKSASFFGLSKRELKSPIDGTVELISGVTGQVTLREPPIPVQVRAYIKGKVVEVLPREGVVVEAAGAFIQGIFGVGGETRGQIKLLGKSPTDVLDASAVTPEHRGKIIVGGSLVTGPALKRAIEVGVAGVVAGGIIDSDLVSLLGYDIGVAITGHEDIPITVIVSEGFGQIKMADKTFKLFQALDGETASINGATQIRAGVMRPELIAPGHKPVGRVAADEVQKGLVPGTLVRVIREPYFGLLARVVDLPPELQLIETEAKVRILRCRLEDGRVVTVPRANVEIIEG